MVVTHEDARELPNVIDEPTDGDRPSITEVNGTVAKFEMAYSPDKEDRFTFGPPILARLPGLIFLAFAAGVAITVITAYNGSSNTALFEWIVEGDRHRAFGSVPLAFIIGLAAVANVVKTELRGIIVTADAIESREMRAGGFPSVKRWAWSQIDRVIVDEESVMLELWDGSYERLPRVHKAAELSSLVARIATARARPVTRLGDKSENRDKPATS